MSEAAARQSVEPKRDARAFVRTWAFALVPLIGVWELVAHVAQVRSVVPLEDWKAARAVVEPQWKAGDLVVFAPDWSDPLGREAFGDGMTGVEVEARPDETRFARAFEVSIRGLHASELRGWNRTGSRKVGAVTVTTLENPAPAHVIDDLLSHASPTGMSAGRVEGGGETECRWVHGPTTAGGLGSGPAIPGDRFACAGGNFVGVSIIHDMEDRPRRCFFAPPGGGSSILRVRFANVAFGTALHGHVGLAQFNERDHTGPTIALLFKAGERTLGKITHVDGDGWKGFELSTTDLQGQHGELVAEITSSGANRHFCFEADTR